MRTTRPNPIPSEPGCLVQRVTAPEGAFEQNYAGMGLPTYRMTLWIDGAVWFGGQANGQTPTLEDCLHSFQANRWGWSPQPF